MSRLTDADIAGIEALASAATPAPWGVMERGPHVVPGPVHCDDDGWETTDRDESGIAQYVSSDADAAFIAAIRNATPNLMAEMSRLRGIEKSTRVFMEAISVEAKSIRLLDGCPFPELDAASLKVREAETALRALLDVTP